MANTARVTILMEDDEKVALTQKARGEGLKVGEYIRTRVLDEADDGVAALLELVQASTQRASRGLDDVLATVAKSRAERPARDAAAAAAARREFASIDFAALNLRSEQKPAPRQRKAG